MCGDSRTNILNIFYYIFEVQFKEENIRTV